MGAGLGRHPDRAGAPESPRRAIVARDARGDDGDEWPAVIWPEDYERRFSYW